MKPTTLLPIRLCLRLILVLLAGTLLGNASPLDHAGRRSLELEFIKDRTVAKVTVPDGVATVTLQRFRRDGGWEKVAVREGVPGVMRFPLPASGKNIRWRAIGLMERPSVSRGKFPKSFYQGESRFGPVKSGGGSKSGMLRTDIVPQESTHSADAPVEADIWKVDGNTVYFFNQLRGLQVLDLTDPADPRMTASLRLPALGQDLYLLPGSGPERNLVLLTQGWSAKSGDWTRINLAKVSGGIVEITHTRDVPGYLADSRMIGNRLVLATTEWFESDDENEGWNATSRLTEWLITPGAAPNAAGETVIDGDSPLIAAGQDWLALAIHPNGRWDVSDVHVFAVRPSGLARMAAPVRTEGSVESQFAMQWSDNVLTTISEKRTRADGGAPATILENFRAWSPDVVHTLVLEGRLGRLRLAKGESLFATRFAGNKAYIVTFLQTDPLFVVDLSDPAAPVIAGHIEVPGWSTHLEPIGDLLFAIGWESNTAVASLFDVANPAAPRLLRRLLLGDPGTYSEALWDEKALKFLPAAGLAMVPLTSYNRKTGASSSVVRLLDVDTAARDIRLRGSISHTFDARRADLLGNSVVSISQRTLVAADVTDRDSPSILSEVSLAWPVDRVLGAGDHLLQVEDGSSYGGGRATVRISPSHDTEAILAEIDLGKGTVKAADLRDGKLFILRETVSSRPFFRRSIIIPETETNRIILDIYDASSLPTVSLLGSRAIRPPAGGHVSLDRLLWPQPNRPSILTDSASPFWYAWETSFKSGDSTTLAAAAAPRGKSSMKTGFRPYWVPGKSPRLIVFDTSDPRNPEAAEPVALGPDGSVYSGVGEAAHGLIVLGNSQWKDPESNKWFTSGESLQSARVIEVEPSGSPIVRPPVDLPGELFAITGLGQDGFLAFTRSSEKRGSTTFQVSACDGYDAFAIDSLETSGHPAATAGGRRLFVASKGGVSRHTLTDDGTFVTEPLLDIGWTADSLRWLDGTLIGGKWNALFATGESDNQLTKWRFPTWNPGIDRITPASGGDLLVPFGEYGVERLER